MLAGFDDEPVVARRDGGVDLACVVGGHVQRLAQAGVAGLGRPTRVGGLSGAVLVGDEAGERADGGEVGEPGGVAEAAGDDVRSAASRSKKATTVAALSRSGSVSAAEVSGWCA